MKESPFETTSKIDAIRLPAMTMRPETRMNRPTRSLLAACVAPPRGVFLSTLAAAQAPASKPAELPRGRLIEKVICQGNPGQSYALYLPRGYQPGRAWPVLYVFDARGQGKAAAAAFQPRPETFGRTGARLARSTS